MKTALTIPALLICSCFVSIPVAGQVTRDLRLLVELTTGERSRDSSSQTTTITVERDAIAWEQTVSGSSRRRPAPARKAFKLSPADKRKLVELIRAHSLLVTDSIELPRAASNYRYFDVSVDLTLDGKQGAISISGMRNAVKVREESLYQHTLALVKELYRIMNGQDKSVQFEELILAPVRP